MNSLIGIIITLGIVLIVFLVCREITCWYWKINEALEVLYDIRDSLSNIESTNKSQLKDQDVSRKRDWPT